MVYGKLLTIIAKKLYCRCLTGFHTRLCGAHKTEIQDTILQDMRRTPDSLLLHN